MITILDIIGLGIIISALVAAGVLLATWIIILIISAFEWWRYR